MQIFIGGAPSTGSSLLTQLLNRHSQICIGPETNLFTKQQLFTDWQKSKGFINSKKREDLQCFGWQSTSFVELENETWSHQDIDKLISTYDTFQEFCFAYFNRIKKSSEKKFWGEKTPSNVNCFKEINDTFTQSKILFTVRNPYDNIASLISRGKSVFESVAIYLWNNSQYLLNIDLPIHIVKYEDLVLNPEAELDKMCSFFNLQFEYQMLLADNKNIKMKGWKNDESGEISSSSLGRFNELSKVQREKVIYYLNHLSINNKEGEQQILFKLILNQFNYSQLSENSNSYYALSLKKDLILSQLKRRVKSLPLSGKDYPFIIE